MAAINYNFDIEKGSDFEINFVYNNISGLPVDLSDKCVIFTLVPSTPTQNSTASDLAVRPYSNENNRDEASLIRDNSGLINIKLFAKETNSYNFLSAVYDLDVRDLSGKSNTRLAAGTINVISRNSSIEVDQFGNFICDAQQNNPNISPTPTDTSITSTPVTLTPTTTATELDFCLPYDCGPLDLFSVVYNGSGLILQDATTIGALSSISDELITTIDNKILIILSDQLNPSIISGQTLVTNTGIITNVELAVNKLIHNNPSDLVLLLAPPSGDKILLSANSKISNFNNNFSFMFSNKATSGNYLYNIPNGGMCNILDKTNIFKYNNENLNSSFSGLFGSSITGVWNFIAMDTDPLGSGSIDSWKLIITYQNDIPENTDPFKCAVPEV